MDGPVHRRILAVIGILAILIWSYRIICVV
jgi:hypothetical protein